MDLNSTPFISYGEIDVAEIDLYDDAWGFGIQFLDVIDALDSIEPDPEDQLIEKLKRKIRENK